MHHVGHLPRMHMSVPFSDPIHSPQAKLTKPKNRRVWVALVSKATQIMTACKTYLTSIASPKFSFILKYIFFTHRVKNSGHLVEAFDVDRIYLRHKNQGTAPDYRVSNVALRCSTNSTQKVLEWRKFLLRILNKSNYVFIIIKRHIGA